MRKSEKNSKKKKKSSDKNPERIKKENKARKRKKSAILIEKSIIAFGYSFIYVSESLKDGVGIIAAFNKQIWLN